MEPWIQTYTGIQFQLLEPTPDMVDVRDIAHALSNQGRYTGHTSRYFSVAEHCLLVSDILRHCLKASPYVQMCGLLHDASETYLSDLASPWKQATPLGPIYCKYEEKIQHAVSRKFSLQPGFDKRSDVKYGDRVSLLLEAVHLMGNPAWCHEGTEMGEAYYPLPTQLWSNTRLRPEVVEKRFLARYSKLMAEQVVRIAAGMEVLAG